MKKTFLLILLLLLGEHLLACGPWKRHDSYYDVGTPFYRHLRSEDPQQGLDNYLRTLMNPQDERERADSLYQSLVDSYCGAVEIVFDPWYYPRSRDDFFDGYGQLEQIALQCRRHSTSGHMLWLHAKCLFQMRRYSECIQFCDDVLAQKLTPYIRARIELWQAGAKVRSAGSSKATDAVYAHYGDFLSFSGDLVSFAQAAPPAQMLDFAYHIDEAENLFRTTPLPYPFSSLIDIDEDISGRNHTPTVRIYREYGKFCESIARKRPVHQASWYYTAALCAYVTHQQAEAKRLLALAGRGVVSPEEEIVLQLLSMKVGLKDHGIRNDADDKAFWTLVSSLSWDVAYAQFHKEVIYYVLPRMAREGRHEQLLRYAEAFCNMPDEYAANGWLLDNVVYGFVDMDAAARYAETSAERDRIYDLLATRCLREMRYAQAADYLHRMSPSYRRGVKTEWGQYWYSEYLEPLFCRDPFSMAGFSQHVRRLRIPIPQYKLKFALRMCALEQAMKDPSLDPNDLADIKALYATGLHNSFNDCWILTDFGQREWFEECKNPKYENEEDRTDLWYFSYNPYEKSRRVNSREDFVKRQYTTRKAMEKRCSKLMDEARNTYTDPNRKAGFYYSLNMFRTVVEQFPTTRVARRVQGHCDRYTDYYSFRK